METPMPRAETVTLWMERLQRFKQSQMTVAQFCAAESVSQPSFYNWKRKLRGDVRFVVETLDGLSCQNLSLQYSDFNDSLSFSIA
jgi:hypothetical protein